MSGDELLDVAKQRLGVAGPESMISVGIFDEFRIGDLSCQAPAEFDRNLRVGPAMQHKCRYAHAGKNRPDVDLRVQQEEFLDGAAAG